MSVVILFAFEFYALLLLVFLNEFSAFLEAPFAVDHVLHIHSLSLKIIRFEYIMHILTFRKSVAPNLKKRFEYTIQLKLVKPKSGTMKKTRLEPDRISTNVLKNIHKNALNDSLRINYQTFFALSV